MKEVGRTKVKETIAIDVALRITPNNPPYSHSLFFTSRPTTKPPIMGDKNDSIFNNQLTARYGIEVDVDLKS